MGWLVEQVSVNPAINADSGRVASRMRRDQLVRGKSGLPPVAERTRTGFRSAAAVTPAPAAMSAPTAPVNQAAPAAKPEAAQLSASAQPLTGREASLVRRQNLVQGKAALQRQPTPAARTETASEESSAPAFKAPAPPVAGTGRGIAQAMRATRATNGRTEATAHSSGRVRASASQPIQYPPKVADTATYAGKKVTGIRIGHGVNVTGNEPGVDVQVTGSQYIGRETGFSPRAGGIKVGAARTASGLIVTGTQVRSGVNITGDESNPALRITGEADQEIADDILERAQTSAYSAMQFQRQHDPHGHSVFGTNLGRSIKTISSRERDPTRTIEHTDHGHSITGTAVGRSPRVTGDEPGSCRSITGDQYLMAAQRQSLCETAAGKAPARAGSAMAMGVRPDAVTGGKVTVAETWARQRVTGTNVEYDKQVSGDEFGVCSPVTGTPYAGPQQYETVCSLPETDETARRATPGQGLGNRVTGDTPMNVEHVTGTQRGAAQGITGSPYYRADTEHDMQGDILAHIEQVGRRFSVRAPQREAQLRASPEAVKAPTAAGRITGTFAAGEGKITGNQEFHFRPRASEERAARIRLTGEGKVEGSGITGTAWFESKKVSGTEGYIATERNPSQRAGKPHAFASAVLFKDKGRHEESRQMVTGMVGWSSKTAAKVTLSGGAQG